MDPLDELYCKIFVDTAESEAWLTNVVARAVKGRVKQWTVDSDVVEVAVSDNKDYDPANRNPDDEFLFYRYYLDVVPLPPPRKSEHIAIVGTLLEALWSEGCLAVASCDYEKDLPRGGGYRLGPHRGDV